MIDGSSSLLRDPRLLDHGLPLFNVGPKPLRQFRQCLGAGLVPEFQEARLDILRCEDWENVTKVMMSRVKQHGMRHAAEMREASRMVTELGLDGSLAAAIAEGHETFARSKIPPGSE